MGAEWQQDKTLSNNAYLRTGHTGEEPELAHSEARWQASPRTR